VLNGSLAGLVAITAGAHAMDAWEALVSCLFQSA